MKISSKAPAASHETTAQCPFKSVGLLLSPLAHFWRWLNGKGYMQGVLWAMLVCLISSFNDVCIRLTGSRLESLQVSFFRFFFSTLTLLPVMLYSNRAAFKTQHFGFHSLRALLGYCAIACWCTGVTLVPLSMASIMAQTVPFFVLPLAAVLLREKIGWQRTVATLAGFLGIALTLQPADPSQAFFSSGDINSGAFWLVAAAVMFAASDILNKKMVTRESDLTMLFYFAFGTTLIGFAPAYFVWTAPTMEELFFLFCLGSGANLILYCLLKAFAATEISALQPYRYVELIFAGLFGWLLFNEVPTVMTLLGAMIIVPSTLAIAYYEIRCRQKTKAAEADIALTPLTSSQGEPLEKLA
jgi:S-adenosylmethionine uptake transporter